ncbi:hypothetical protein [Thermococcus sp. MV11]|uniref:hypothetical protein n=1 Tax=Thermococcus sp. MV11 TaxID=1638267 RepID=UPI00142F9705|nr:hypothetical protein [Thermococcus sp. MV11]NJE03810.1 hypothetical protein [Thermococcus sp. MV11]
MRWASLLLLIFIISPLVAAEEYNVIGPAETVAVAPGGDYYIVVRGDGSFVNATLVRVLDDNPVKNVTVDSVAGVYVLNSNVVLDVDSLVEDSFVRYIVVWKAKNDSYIYYSVIDSNGDTVTRTTRLDVIKPDYISVSNGGGYFVVVYEKYNSNELYYSVLDASGDIVDRGLLYTGKGAIHYSVIAYDRESGYFGVAFRESWNDGSSYNLTFIDFKLLPGGAINLSSVHRASFPVRVSAVSVAPGMGGFFVAYREYYSPYSWVVIEIPDPQSPGTYSQVVELSRARSSVRGDLDLVPNETSPYLVFAYENQTSDLVYVIKLVKIGLNGDILGALSIIPSSGNFRYPSLAVSSVTPVEAYAIGWLEADNGRALSSEYKSDLTAVSEVNQVPFFGTPAVAVALVVIAWFVARR